jgi:hypothetical protein
MPPVPLTGFVADRIGIESTLLALSLVPLIGAACALPLPRTTPPRLGSVAAGPSDPPGVVR